MRPTSPAGRQQDAPARPGRRGPPRRSGAAAGAGALRPVRPDDADRLLRPRPAIARRYFCARSPDAVAVTARTPARASAGAAGPGGARRAVRGPRPGRTGRHRPGPGRGRDRYRQPPARLRAGRRARPLRGRPGARQYDAVEPENRLVARTLDGPGRQARRAQPPPGTTWPPSRPAAPSRSPATNWPGSPAPAPTCAPSSTPRPPPPASASADPRRDHRGRRHR